MFVGLIFVPVPLANVNVKKLFVDKLTDAVFEEIDNAEICPRNDPVTSVALLIDTIVPVSVIFELVMCSPKSPPAPLVKRFVPMVISFQCY